MSYAATCVQPGNTKKVQRLTSTTSVCEKSGFWLELKTRVTVLFEHVRMSTCTQKYKILTDPKNCTYDFAEGIRKHEQDFTPDVDD
jgi:hypothetical protein